MNILQEKVNLNKSVMVCKKKSDVHIKILTSSMSSLWLAVFIHGLCAFLLCQLSDSYLLCSRTKHLSHRPLLDI